MSSSILPALGWGSTPEPPYYVAIFTSQRGENIANGTASQAPSSIWGSRPCEYANNIAVVSRSIQKVDL